MMRISCPHCGFEKEIAIEQVPANVVRVTCPACRQPFPLERVEETVVAEDMSQETPDTRHDTEDETALENTVANSDTVPEKTEVTNATETEPARSELDKSVEPACGEHVEPATIGSRYAALLIDTMLIMIMVIILRFGLTLLGNGIQLEGQIMLGAVFTLFTLTLGFAYHTLFIGICGQTPGKMLLRIRVIAINYSAMTYRQAMLREVLGKTLSLPLLLGYMMAIFNPRHLAAHDKIADTCVIKLTTDATVD